MIVSPINIAERQQSVLVVVIEKDNLERMKQGDPITIESHNLGGSIMRRVAYPQNLSLLIAYEEDDVELYKLANAGDLPALVKYLERGRKFDPKTDGLDNMFSFRSSV